MKRTAEYPCPTCGGFARTVIAPDKAAGRNETQFACARCGTVLEPLPFAPRRWTMAQPTPIRMGMKALIGGKEFWAVGIIRWTEKDDDSTSTWYEWVLLSPDGTMHYLEFDSGKWTLTEPMPPPAGFPDAQLMTLKAASTVHINGALASVSEAGLMTVSGYDGQIPWPIQNGEQARYVDFTQSGQVISAERSPNGENEWFRGRQVDIKQVLTWFNLQEELRALDRHAGVMRQRAGFGGLCLLLAILAFIGAGIGSRPGRIIGEGSTSAAQIPEAGQRFGPFSLTRTNRVYRLRVATNLSSSSMYVQAVLENADAGPTFDVEGELWDESGYDDDGYWHENQLESQRDFRLDTPRKVYVRLYADPDAAAANAPVSFALEEASLTTLPLFIFGIAGSVVGVIMLPASLASKKWNGGAYGL